MADNVAVTAGAGTTVAADEVVDGTLGTVKVQYVKLMDGTLDGTTKATVGANGVKVDPSAVTSPVSLASVPTHAVTQSGTWTVQPGNTANTTPWLIKINDGTTALPVLAASSGSPAATVPALPVSVRDANPNQTADYAKSVGAAPVMWPQDQAIALRATTTTNGTTSSRVVAAATTNATNLKASAGKMMSVRVFNVAAYDVFLKFYNKASAPTVGTDTPVWTIPLKTGTGFSEHFHLGFDFSTGISYAITKLQADTDTTAVAASDVTGTIGWI